MAKIDQLKSDLAPVLAPGEQLLALSSGLAHVRRMGQNSQRRGTIFVTDRRVGVFTKKLGGHDLLDFSYGLLTSVQYKKGLMFGEITLLASGDSTMFQQIPKDHVEAIAQTIRQRMALAHDHTSSVAPSPVPQPATSIADELTKLAQLRDSGVLTIEEFELQKAKLLGQ